VSLSSHRCSSTGREASTSARFPSPDCRNGFARPAEKSVRRSVRRNNLSPATDAGCSPDCARIGACVPTDPHFEITEFFKAALRTRYSVNASRHVPGGRPCGSDAPGIARNRLVIRPESAFTRPSTSARLSFPVVRPANCAVRQRAMSASVARHQHHAAGSPDPGDVRCPAQRAPTCESVQTYAPAGHQRP